MRCTLSPSLSVCLKKVTPFQYTVLIDLLILADRSLLQTVGNIDWRIKNTAFLFDRIGFSLNIVLNKHECKTKMKSALIYGLGYSLPVAQMSCHYSLVVFLL